MFAERLKEARKRKGLSQRALANRLEMHHTEVSKYENRKREPGLHKLANIARELGVATDYLLGLSDEIGE